MSMTTIAGIRWTLVVLGLAARLSVAAAIGGVALRGSGGGGGGGGFVLGGSTDVSLTGFFVAGTTTLGVGGMYGPKLAADEVEEQLPWLAPDAIWVYRHDHSGWILAKVSTAPTDPGTAEEDPIDRWEWVLIDPNRRDRFHQPRNSDYNKWGPEYGPNWRFCDRASRGIAALLSGPDDSETVVVDASDDNADAAEVEEGPGAGAGAEEGERAPSDLPWQVVGIRKMEKFETIRDAQRRHDVQEAEAVNGLLLLADIEGAATRPNAIQCAAETPPADLGQAGDDSEPAGCQWGEAVGLRQVAAAKRETGEDAAALVAADAALRLAPRFAAARYEKAKSLLDLGRAAEAVAAFRAVFILDGAAPDLGQWLLRAHVRARRAAPASAPGAAAHGGGRRDDGIPSEVGGAVHEAVRVAVDRVLRSHGLPSEHSEQAATEAAADAAAAVAALLSAQAPAGAGAVDRDDDGAGRVDASAGLATRWASGDFFTVLGLHNDATEEQLKQQYRELSKEWHPDRPGGSGVAFAAVAGAYECLSKEACRVAHEAGEDLPQEQELTVAEAVQRQYAPHAFDYEPFGDPFSRNRGMQAVNARTRWERTATKLRSTFDRYAKECPNTSASGEATGSQSEL